MPLKHYLRDRRGVASIEAALGTVAILTASAACPGPVPAGQHPDDHPARRRYPGGHREPGRSTRSELCPDAGRISAPGAVPHLERRLCGLRGVQEPHQPRSSAHRALDRNGRARPGRRSSAHADLVQWGVGNQYRHAEQSGYPAGRIYHVARRTRHCRSGVRRADEHRHAGAVYAHYIVPARADNLATNLGATG